LFAFSSSAIVAREAGAEVRIAVGNYHTCAVTDARGAKCWGHNYNGQLGDGTTADRHTADFVDGFTRRAGPIAAGSDYSCAATTTGIMKCWGYNGYGQLGDGTTAEQHTPINVDGLTFGVFAVATGFYHTCALIEAGEGEAGRAKCWGNNGSGQLGDGTTTVRYTPINVDGLRRGVTGIEVGGHHTCAVVSGGVRCWGYNGYGQIGDGTATDRHAPTMVPGLTNGVRAIALGNYHTCALNRRSGVECWGHNSSGQIGDGTTTSRYSPIRVPGVTRDVLAIALGGAHTCALIKVGDGKEGGVKCWGYNGYGQLGDGTTTDRHTPVDVLGF
jgi:alpha-tubulin suppressor-like RCC1 family protein